MAIRKVTQTTPSSKTSSSNSANTNRKPVVKPLTPAQEYKKKSQAAQSPANKARRIR